jgi:hypothetical protein
LLLGIAGGIIGVVLGFPPIYKHVAEGKRKSTLHDQIKQINEIYYFNNSIVKNKEQVLMKLKQKRIEIQDLLANGKIDEDQYKMLDDKISEYEERAHN